MGKIQAVIFDMDGVIFDSESLWKIMFEKANDIYKVSLDEKYRQSICGKTEEVIRRELNELIPELNADEYRDYIASGVNSMIASGDFEIKSGFNELISYLREKGYKTALATSSVKARAKHMFDAKGFDADDIFDACIYGDEVKGKSKPDPYIFNTVASKLGYDNSECIVVEDSINGIQAAVSGGFVPVMAVDLIPPDSYCRENCYQIIDNLTQLIEMMEREKDR